ncbi:MAG: glycosyltransferase [Alphaproteobacteria bacterium]|nr:MAG: glycosyltransferase [Alphaproteobacteria bacterium]
MSRTTDLATRNVAGRFTSGIAGFLLFSIMTIVTIQYWWKLPLERLGSPADILGLMLGLVLGFACLLLGFRAEPRSPAGRAFTGMAGLFLALTLVEYIAEAGPIDIPISFLWLMPALILALTPIVSKDFGTARLSFAVCTAIQLAEVVRSILATTYYGGSGEPPVFEWIESASDLLVRAFFLLGFVEALRLVSRPIAGSFAGNGFTPTRRDERRRHVAFFMYKLSGGGAQRRAVTLANGLAALGYDVDFVVINDRSKIRELLAPGLRFIELNSPRWGGLHAVLYRHLPSRTVRVYLGAVAFARYLLAEKPGTIVAGSSRVLLSAVIAWLIAGRTMPLVLRATNFPSGNFNLWRPVRPIVDLYLRALLRLVFPPASATVAVGDGVAEEVARLSGMPRQRIATVFEPVLDGTVAERSRAPLDHPWLAPGEPPVLLAVGRLRMQKDFPTLIRAFALARAKRPMRLVVLGEGRDRPRLQKMIEALGIADDVCLFGRTENPFAWMARVSMFVLSSAWEGLPAVLIEALACGCPVVSTNCPSGPWEILEGGKYGRLVPCRDPERLAEAILAALDTPVDRQALVERACAFSAEASVNGYIRVFEACHTEDGTDSLAGTVKR